MNKLRIKLEQSQRHHRLSEFINPQHNKDKRDINMQCVVNVFRHSMPPEHHAYIPNYDYSDLFTLPMKTFSYHKKIEFEFKFYTN